MSQLLLYIPLQKEIFLFSWTIHDVSGAHIQTRIPVQGVEQYSLSSAQSMTNFVFIKLAQQLSWLTVFWAFSVSHSFASHESLSFEVASSANKQNPLIRKACLKNSFSRSQNNDPLASCSRSLSCIRPTYQKLWFSLFLERLEYSTLLRNLKLCLTLSLNHVQTI